MRILLINPPNSGKSIPEEEYGIQSLKMIFRGEPLCLETIAGNLNEHEIKIADLKADPDALQKIAETFQPELAGITGLTCEANAVLDIAKQLKSLFDLTIVVGGHHASCDPEFFNTPYIDYVVIGLGKLSFRELIHALERKKNTRAIPGVAKVNPSVPLSYLPRKYSQADLVDHSAPRYDLVEKYRESYVMTGVGGKMGFVATAFGCTHRCSFCSIPNMTGAKYLTHSVDAVLRDISFFPDIPIIRLVDANTFGRIQEAEKLARKIMAFGIHKHFIADVRSDTVIKHPEFMKLWKHAGLTTVVIGFEEISDKRLEAYNKRNTNSINIAAMEILKDLDIRVIGDFIVSPDYEEKDFNALERFVEKSQIDLPMPSILTPIPGTPLYEKMRGKIEVHNLDYYTFTNAVLPTKMPKKDFYLAYSNLMKKFHQHIRK